MKTTEKEYIDNITSDPIMDYINGIIEKILNYFNATGAGGAFIKFSILLILMLLFGYILYFALNWILKLVFKRTAKVAPIAMLRYAIPNKLPQKLALIAPYTSIKSSIPLLFSDYSSWIVPMVKTVDICLVFIIISIIMAILKSLADGLQERPAFKDKPMKSYLQVVQIIFVIIGAVGIFSIVTGKSATVFFTAMGAASAVMMLAFKDSIMGFVSSIQLTTNEMVKIGDWITMKKYGADGNVIEISLTTVKVQNFDKTITTIPTYSLISDSFQNWRGMQDSGGRRIKKCIYVQQNTIRFATNEELEKYKEVDYLKDFIAEKQKTYATLNTGIDNSSPVGAHRLTNNELFIAYATGYFRHHPHIKQDFTLMVRQMEPTINGMQIEVYVFTDTVVWTEYEAISVEVLNHLISAAPFFDLKIFEATAGSDGYTVKLEQ